MYSTIVNDEFHALVVMATEEHPEIGIRMLTGYLKSKGHRIQRHRIYSSLQRTDPIGLIERWQLTVKRRQYYVKYPNSLWHIDGNHKLIRYSEVF